MKKFTLNEEIAKMRKIMGLNEAEDFDLSSVDNPNAYTDDIINHNAERGEGPSHFDFQEAQEIFYNKEVLTDKEAQLVKYFMPKKAEAYLFHRSWDNTYLNLYLYSEADKEEYDFKRETGGFSSEENPIEGMKLNENPVEYTSALGNEIRKNFVMKGGYNGEKYSQELKHRLKGGLRDNWHKRLLENVLEYDCMRRIEMPILDEKDMESKNKKDC